jgi:hypothetical protein
MSRRTVLCAVFTERVDPLVAVRVLFGKCSEATEFGECVGAMMTVGIDNRRWQVAVRVSRHEDEVGLH